MFSFVKLPAQALSFLLGVEISSREVALGVCLAMFMGFVPFNGPLTILLIVLFFIIRLNRFSTLLTLPIFKLAYVLGVSSLTDRIGAYLLIEADYLTYFWRVFTGLPVIAYLDFNNTLVAGGTALSLVLFVPVYFISKKAYVLFIEKYVKNIRNTKLFKSLTRFKLFNKLILTMERIRSKTE